MRMLVLKRMSGWLWVCCCASSLVALAAAGCGPTAVLTIAGPDEPDAPAVPLSPSDCMWFRVDDQSIRIVVDYRQLRSAGIWWAGGVRPKRITLVIDVPATAEQIGPATAALTADTLCGMDLTRSGVIYLLGKSGQIDWSIDETNTLTASLNGICLAYPHKFKPEDRLTEDYDLTAKLTALHDPEGGRKAAAEVIWSVRH